MPDKLIHLCIDGTRQSEWKMKVEKRINEIINKEAKTREKEGRETLKNCGDATPMIRDGTFYEVIQKYQEKTRLNIFFFTPPSHRGLDDVKEDEECRIAFLKILDSLEKKFPTIVCKCSFNERKFPKQYDQQIKGMMVAAFVHGAIIIEDLEKLFCIIKQFVRSE